MEVITFYSLKSRECVVFTSYSSHLPKAYVPGTIQTNIYKHCSALHTWSQFCFPYRSLLCFTHIDSVPVVWQIQALIGFPHIVAILTVLHRLLDLKSMLWNFTQWNTQIFQTQKTKVRSTAMSPWSVELCSFFWAGASCIGSHILLCLDIFSNFKLETIQFKLVWGPRRWVLWSEMQKSKRRQTPNHANYVADKGSET